MTSKYRIEAIEIAGFKAFTTPQKVPIDGRTTFIFGENGLGKSSVVEAIVWCLYGTENEVRNQLYQGPCVVNLYLRETTDSSKIYRIQRRMHQADNGSDVDVTLPEGTLQNITDFIPQLKKLEHGPGTRVIFAEQESGRRYSHDLNNFEALIAAYLGLDVAYSLDNWLSKFIEEQGAIFDTQVRVKETEISKEINSRVQNTHSRINDISAQPPWEGQFPPSEGETIEKVHSMIRDISLLLGEDYSPISNIGLDALLIQSVSKIRKLEGFSKSSLEAAITILENKLSNASRTRNKLQDTIQKVLTDKNSLITFNLSLKELIDGKSESVLNDEKEELQNSQGMLLKRANLIREAQLVLTDSVRECPVCDTEIGADELKRRLELHQTEVTSDTIDVQTKIENINTRLFKLASTKKAIQLTTDSMGLAKQEQSEIEAELISLLGIQQVTVLLVDSKLVELRKSLDDLRNKVLTESVKLSAFNDQLLKYQRTAEYHKLIRYLSKLDGFLQSEDYRKALAKIAEFDQHMHSIKKIHRSLENAYFKAFSSYLPVLSKEMTQVYRQLTRQKSFDTIRIVPEPGNVLNKSRGKMVLQVGSPLRDIWVTPDDANVLNGQALSALNLVPYFAFAKMGMSKHEIDFLLIDDPSQSFDTSHVEYLLDLLKNVSNSAQVIIATHERDRIQSKLSSFFSDYNIINVDSFDVDSGPHYSQEMIKNS